MQDPTVQGQLPVEPAVPAQPVQGQPPKAEPAGLDSLQQFVVQPEPNAEPAAQQGTQQGQPQEPQGTQIDPAKHFQSLYGQTYAELQHERQLRQALERQVQPQQTQQPQQQNPYDPQADFYRWISFEQQRTAQMTAQAVRNEMVSSLMQAAQTQAELQWQQAHPGVDINAIKAFAQSRWGVQQVPPQMLDDAVAILNYPNQINQVRANAMQQTFNQFRQPTGGAQPVRGAASAEAGIVGLSYAKLAEAFVRSPGVYDTWPKEVQEMFDKETLYRRSHPNG